MFLFSKGQAIAMVPTILKPDHSKSGQILISDLHYIASVDNTKATGISMEDAFRIKKLHSIFEL